MRADFGMLLSTKISACKRFAWAQTNLTYLTGITNYKFFKPNANVNHLYRRKYLTLGTGIILTFLTIGLNTLV